MRYLLALMVLLCGAVNAPAFPADGVPYCSSGFEKPAKLVFNAGDMTLMIGQVTEKFAFHEPLEEGVDGFAFDNAEMVAAGTITTHCKRAKR